MAKYIKTYENGIVEHRLTFRGRDFTITMIPDDTGSHSKEKAFEYQLEEAYPSDEDIETISDTASCLDVEDDDEIFEILDDLGRYE